MIKQFLLICFCASLANGTTYYIKNGGNDGNTGLSDGQAWENLDKIRTSVSSNDTVYLKRGSTWSDCGTADYACIHIDNKNNITIDAYDSGADPIIDNTGQDDPVPNENDPDYCTIQVDGSSSGNSFNNLDLRGAEDTSVILVDASNTGNSFTDVSMRGEGFNTDDEASIASIETNTTFTRCTFDGTTGNTNGYRKLVNYDGGLGSGTGGAFYDCIFAGWYTEGIFFKELGASTIYIERCYFYHPNDRSLTFSYRRAVAARSMSYGSVEFKIKNCIFDVLDRSSDAISGWSTAPRFFIVNNTFISANRDTAIDSSNDDDIYLVNNIFYDWATAFDDPDSPGTEECRNNYYYSTTWLTCNTDTGNLSKTPAQLDIDDVTGTNDVANDFKIGADSDCIGAGHGTPGSGEIPADDYSEVSRGATADIGAFEYAAASNLVVLRRRRMEIVK